MINIDDLISQAIKAGDNVATRVFRNIKSEKQKILTSATNKKYNENVEIDLIKRLVKQRQEAKEMYLQNNRSELASMENEEMLILQNLLPNPSPLHKIEETIYEISKEQGFEFIDDAPIIPRKMMGMMVTCVKEAHPANEGKEIANLIKNYLA